jgi:hypothetical protein
MSILGSFPKIDIDLLRFLFDPLGWFWEAVLALLAMDQSSGHLPQGSPKTKGGPKVVVCAHLGLHPLGHFFQL